MSYLNTKRQRKNRIDRVNTKEFKKGKVCEICSTGDKLTVHNHKLPKKFWKVFCRKCHDEVDGIVRDDKGRITAFLKYEDDIRQSQYETPKKLCTNERTTMKIPKKFFPKDYNQ